MTSLPAVSTARMLQVAAPVADSSIGVRGSTAGSFRLLDWLVDLTEATQRFLARCADAERRFGGRVDDRACFGNDAAGGGSRSLAAARCLRAQALRQ